MGNTNETTGAEALFASLSEEQTLELGKLLGELGIAAVGHVLSRCEPCPTHNGDDSRASCRCEDLHSAMLVASKKHEKAAHALTDALLAMVPQ